MRTSRRAPSVALAVRLVLVLGLVTGGLITAAWPAPPPLSADQKRRLNAGEVLVRDDMPPGASESARGGTALGLVHGTPEQVWKVLVDYPGHSRYYPRVTSAELVESDDRRVVVRYTVGIGPFTSTFHMDKFPDARRRRIEWHLSPDRATGMFRENSGYWQVDELDRASLVTYAIAVRTVLPSFMTGSSERDSLVETIVGLRRVVEQESAAPKPR